MTKEKGSLSINSENILPIIKKWLYTDSDIFLREMVSNATDAVTKVSRLATAGEADIPEDEKFYVKVVLDKEAGTITVSDNGIGMTSEEVKKYINQIAFSGASEFIGKYKEKMEAGNDIIGHFGLGFYSAFMVSKTVRIDSLSYVPGETAVRWVSDGGVEYEMEESPKTGRGTDVTLYMSDDGKEFLDEYRLRGILRKYCAFMPVDIFFEIAGKEDTAGDLYDDDDVDIEGDEAGEESAETKKKPKPINDKNPLWNKKPADVTDDEYKAFYHKVFTDFNAPLFWIHLNMDYPFRLKGILYFPKLNHELESIEGQVKLYNSQVYIAENIKEVIPEFLLLLKGVMDCPDLPLNVSRSALKNDGYVAKMSAYITKKVADKLTEMFNSEREQYNKFWDDISPFIKYGCIREKDFYGKVKDAVLFRTTEGKHLTVSEYLAANEVKTVKRIIYATDENKQAQYLKLTSEQGVDAVLLGTRIDNPFMSCIESYESERGVKFVRVDADLSEILSGGEDESDAALDTEAISGLFRDAIGNEKLKIKVESLKNEDTPAIVTLSEESRRMAEMGKMFGGAEGGLWGNFEAEETLVLNSRNGLVRLLHEIGGDDGRKDDAALVCRQIYDLAMMGHRQLSPAEMTEFMLRSSKLMEKIFEQGEN